MSPAVQVPVDAVQEYRVITSNYGPEYGRASGGVVNLVTKSGTNSIHGSAWEFYRPSTFAANSYYNNANGISRAALYEMRSATRSGSPLFMTSLRILEHRVAAGPQQQRDPVQHSYVAIHRSSAPATQAFFSAFGKVSGTPTGVVYTLSQLDGTSTPFLYAGFKTDSATFRRRALRNSRRSSSRSLSPRRPMRAVESLRTSTTRSSAWTSTRPHARRSTRNMFFRTRFSRSGLVTSALMPGTARRPV